MLGSECYIGVAGAGGLPVMPGVTCHGGVGGALTSSEGKVVMMACSKRLTCLLHNYNGRKQRHGEHSVSGMSRPGFPKQKQAREEKEGESDGHSGKEEEYN